LADDDHGLEVMGLCFEGTFLRFAKGHGGHRLADKILDSTWKRANGKDRQQ
jgi:hypothetical protein